MHTPHARAVNALGPPLRLAALVAAVAAVAPLAAPVHAQTVTIGASRQTEFAPLGFLNEGTAGRSETQIGGQLFQTPNNVSTSLTSWSFWASNYLAGSSGSEFTTALLRLTILEWDGSAPVGPALFTSAPITPTNTDPTGVADEFTIAVGLTLDPTKVYLALVSAVDQGVANQLSPVPFGCNHGFCLPALPDLYPGGGLVFIQTAFDPVTQMFRGIDDQPYIVSLGDQADMTFEATFNSSLTATPEPASMTLMATGLIGIAGFARRRRKSAVAE